MEQEPPQLLVNRDAKPSWKELARSPYFITLVYPEVLRRILLKVLVEDNWSEEDDDSDWGSDWIRFARNLGGLHPVPAPSMKLEREIWVTDAVSAFARRMQLRNLWDKEYQAEG